MPRWTEEKLDEEYTAWLEEFCTCNLLEDGCSCMDFDKWFIAKMEDYAESLDTEEYYI